MSMEMSTTLYRKYRPQTFADLSGQNHIKITLGNEIAMGKVTHAYLFTGPRGVGKTTTARLLAKAINCENRKEGESEPCNNCEACLSITENRALDVMEIDAASHTGVDNVRENIIENVRFTPSRLKNKVFIIDEVHMLSASAWNALLKTLEEPPAHAILILATTEAVKIPATIISRCQRFDFHRISVESLVERLKKLAEAEGVEVQKEVLYSIARYADGGLRDAESMLGQILALGEDKITLDVASLVLPHSSFETVLSFMDILARRASSDALREVNRLMEEGVDPRSFIDELIDFGRKLLLTKFSGSLQEFAVGFDTVFAERILDYAKTFATTDLINLLEKLLLAREATARAKIVQLPLEMAVVEFCESIQTNAVTTLPKLEAVQSARPLSNFVNSDGPESKAVHSDKPKKEPAFAPVKEAKNEAQEKLDVLGAEKAEMKLSNAPEPSISLERVRELWPEFIKRVFLQNPSLRVALGVGRPISVSGGALQVGVQYKFHAERLNDIKNRLILELVLKELFGVSLRMQGVISQDAPKEAVSNPMIKQALEAFGGRVVE